MFKKVHASELPKRPRKVVSRFENTPEWKSMKADFDRGLKPHEALMITLSKEEKAKYGISNRRTVARFIQKYLAEHNLPYKFRSFVRLGEDFFSVHFVPPPPKSNRH